MIKVKKQNKKTFYITIYTFIQQIIDHIPDIIPSMSYWNKTLSHYTEEVILLEQMSEWNY